MEEKNKFGVVGGGGESCVFKENCGEITFAI
jgi:hypothetical protein